MEFFKYIDNKDEWLNQIHDIYQKRIDYIGVPKENKDIFVWSDDKKINLFLIQIADNNCKFLTFAFPSSNNKNNLLFNNQIDNTKGYQFEKHFFDYDFYLNQINYKNHNILNKFLPKIHRSSLEFLIIPRTLITNVANKSWIESWIKRWVDNEYESANKFLSTHIEKQINLSTNKFYVNRFHFDEMLQSISNKQFLSEFNEIIQVYEQGLWFVCATSLGSILEYLMYLTIKNYNNKEMLKALGIHPLLDNYMRAFRLPPISIDMRQESYIRAIFMLRNSVSHYNSGYTSKETCNIMFDGLTMIYNNFYLKSLEYKS